MKPVLIDKKIYKDNRGYFQEVFKKNEIQINKHIKFTAMSYSVKNVIRGLHFQKKNKQLKIITVVKGKILDVCVNLRRNSKYFKKVYKFLLTPGKILIIPNYYAHGFECLSKEAYLFYHIDKYQDKKNESGILYNDKELKIKWKTRNPILSNRDKNLISLNEFKNTIGSL
jgi:dTDP-4-dehydrorhamnose 3,5-epimerase